MPSDRIADIARLLMEGDAEGVAAVTGEALASGTATRDVLDGGLIAGMEKIGELFKNHEIFLPEVLMAAKAMKAGMEVLKPALLREGIPPRGKVVLGTVRGDLHDIGKNLVGIMLGGAGYEVIDLGTDVPPERFIESALSEGAAVIGLSALLTTTMPVMKDVVCLMKDRRLYGPVKVVVGGASVTEQFAREIGAHGYGFDAASAVDLVNGLTRG